MGSISGRRFFFEKHLVFVVENMRAWVTYRVQFDDGTRGAGVVIIQSAIRGCGACTGGGTTNSSPGRDVVLFLFAHVASALIQHLKLCYAPGNMLSKVAVCLSKIAVCLSKFAVFTPVVLRHVSCRPCGDICLSPLNCRRGDRTDCLYAAGGAGGQLPLR